MAQPWLYDFGEADLIGGWAEVALDREFAASIERPGYQVFLTPYDPVQLFVHNRGASSFEIHALPGTEGRWPMTAQSEPGNAGLARADRTRR